MRGWAGGGGTRFGLHAGAMAVVAVVSLGLTAWVPRTPETRLSAFLGVGLASLSGVLALGLKRRAVKADMQTALKVVGVVFGARAVLVVGGLLWVVTRGLETLPFVVGFFGVYFALQWIEISYVTATSSSADGEE